MFWEKQAQDRCDLRQDRVAMNLQPDQEGLLECRGKIQGEYPIYLPDTHMFSYRVVEEAHIHTLHGGVGLTMAKVRSHFWIPRLRQLVKKVRGSCHGVNDSEPWHMRLHHPGIYLLLARKALTHTKS